MLLTPYQSLPWKDRRRGEGWTLVANGCDPGTGLSHMAGLGLGPDPPGTGPETGLRPTASAVGMQQLFEQGSEQFALIIS